MIEGGNGVWYLWYLVSGFFVCGISYVVRVVLEIWGLVSGITCLVSCMSCMVSGIWYLVSGISCLISGIAHVSTSIWYLLYDNWYQICGI